jgi:hypothetical protein
MRKLLGSLLLGITFMFGTDVVVESPKEITRVWEEKFLGIKYDVTTLDNAVQEMVGVLIDATFDKEFIARITEVIKKQPKGEGEYTEYWENGKLKARLPFKDGKANGHLHGWYDNGLDAFKGYFTAGVKQGIHITFYKTEPNENQEKARLLIFDLKGKLDGTIRTYHQTGDLWIFIEYVNGKVKGLLEGWDKNGKCYLEVQYKNGILQKQPPPPLGKRPEPKPTPDGKYAAEIIKEFEKEACKEFGIEAMGAGGQMPFDVVSFDVRFWVRKKGTVEEARELIVKLKEKLRVTINKHEKIRPYLRAYPFPIKNTNVTISFPDQDKNGVLYDKSVTFASVGSNGKIYYRYDDPNLKGFQPLYEEPYEEAVKIVHGKK